MAKAACHQQWHQEHTKRHARQVVGGTQTHEGHGQVDSVVAHEGQNGRAGLETAPFAASLTWLLLNVLPR